MQTVAARSRSDDALHRLVRIASGNGPHARRTADFLLAWHCAGDHGGWDPKEFSFFDPRTAQDILDVLKSVHKCPASLECPGLMREIASLTRIWRDPRPRFPADEQF
jgi:hypothetical protein